MAGYWAGKKRPLDTVNKIANSNRGKKRSEKTKMLQSQSAKKRWEDVEQRLNASLKKKGSLNPNWNPDREHGTFVEKVRGDFKKVKKNVFKKSHLDEIVSELGYSARELMKNIEAKFQPGMSWENWGEWHIDHVIPVSRWEKTSTSMQVNSLSNLRPLWKEENYRKNARLDNELVENSV